MEGQGQPSPPGGFFAVANVEITYYERNSYSRVALEARTRDIRNARKSGFTGLYIILATDDSRGDTGDTNRSNHLSSDNILSATTGIFFQGRT